MKSLFRGALFISLASLLTACPSNPVRVNIQEASDPSLTCPELQREIARTEQFKVDARADDHFRFQDIILTTGIQSAYNINKAESNAIKRIEYLQSLYRQKNCSSSLAPSAAAPSTAPMTPPTASPYPTPSYMPYPPALYGTDNPGGMPSSGQQQ